MLHQLSKAVLASLLVLAPGALAQEDCASLAVAHQGTVTGGGTLTVDVDGTLPDSFVLLIVGRELGTTCLPLGMDQLCLGITFPALVFPIGVADAAGDLSLVIDLPAGPSELVVGTLHFQVVEVRIEFGTNFMPTIEVCASNVATVEFAQS